MINLFFFKIHFSFSNPCIPFTGKKCIDWIFLINITQGLSLWRKCSCFYFCLNRTIFQKAGGNLGTQGSASHNFNQLGIIKIDKKEISDDQIFELATNAGADECKSENDFHEIQCPVSEIYNVKKELEKEITNFISTEIEWVPLNSVKISKEKNEDLINFFELLEDNDDVQNVYSNAEFVN